MSYFKTHYSELRFPIADAQDIGFRAAQIAAAQAVSAHFFSSKQPAIVTMPTGSGKTTVLMAVAFLLRPIRVLILTPSRLVREQIAENFNALADLKKIGALPLELPTPSVSIVDEVISSVKEWENLREHDVVVATVPSVSPRDKGVAEPPADLFDLVLVDEAHHAPAKTWSRLLDLLSHARQVLFTATPFRRDEREIKGKFVFTYDLRRAYEDRVFGDIVFEAVEATEREASDVSIAKATAIRFKRDRDDGLRHLVMVRADTVVRAKELKKIYDHHTSLNLAFVSGNHSLGHVKAIVEKLRSDSLHGVVCVNMFGEGFNLPNLKIAAVHSPHKSLAVTLQFIGRFARVGQAGIGSATFLAVPAESHAELGQLYESGAIWREIVQNLAGARIESEVRRREVLDSFVVNAAPDMGDFSLYAVRPYFHAKIFSVSGDVDLSARPDFPEKMQIIFEGSSGAEGAVIYLTREAVRSPWSADERFMNVAYDLFIFHHNAAAKLLFVCASRRHSMLYARLARRLVGGRPRPVAQSSVSRALNGFSEMEFFSVGMRRRHRLGRIESYRMVSGEGVDRGIQPSDGRMFDRGHCFGKGLDGGGDEITIGVSSSSKVWSNTYDQIPELLNWCNTIAEKVASGRASATGSRIDLLSTGEELNQVPPDLIAMTWAPAVYRNPPPVSFLRSDGERAILQLLDFELVVTNSRVGRAEFSLRHEQVEWNGVFSFAESEIFSARTANEPDLLVLDGSDGVPIADFLNEEMPTFYSSDLSAIEGPNLFRVPEDVALLGDDSFEVIDWTGVNVDIEKEKPAQGGRRSIFEWLEGRLLGEAADVVFCDDGAGEIADFIALYQTATGARVEMYHCKKSGAAQPGERVDDLYEVCGQAVKSSMWLRPNQLLEQLRHRTKLPSIRGYIRGDDAVANRILAIEARREVQFVVYIVQPGIRRSGRPERISQLLAAVNSHLVQGGVERFGIIAS